MLVQVNYLVAIAPSSLSLTSATIVWLIAGGGLCLSEVFIPTAYAQSMLGISALIVAGLSFVIPSIPIQICLWLLFSSGLVVASRRLLPSSKATRTLEAKEARTTTEIPAGSFGRVLYEGNSWKAQCDDEEMSIAPNQNVYVVGRKGNTLIVMPDKSWH